MVKGKYDVWDFFVGLDDRGDPVSAPKKPKFARCKLCDTWKQVANATRMARHLQDKHTESVPKLGDALNNFWYLIKTSSPPFSQKPPATGNVRLTPDVRASALRNMPLFASDLDPLAVGVIPKVNCVLDFISQSGVFKDSNLEFKVGQFSNFFPAAQLCLCATRFASGILCIPRLVSHLWGGFSLSFLQVDGVCLLYHNSLAFEPPK